MEFYIALIALYFLLIFSALDFKNFGLRKPFLFNFNLNSVMLITHFLLIYFGIMSRPENVALGIAHQLMLIFILPLYFAMFFNRRRFGYMFILFAVILSLFLTSRIYLAVDNLNYSFATDSVAVNKAICTIDITNMMADLESAKIDLPETDEIRLKNFPDQVLNASSEIYLYMKKKYDWKRNFNSRMRHIVPLWHSKYTGVYAIEERDHHYYLKGGKFNDLTIYCDNVQSFEVESAVKKALADFKKMKK